MIGIIDYGLGNINAFLNIYKKLHVPAKRLRILDDFSDVEKLILPGVGAFDHAMESFNKSGIREIVEKMVLTDKVPVIGICVGMQMLAGSSDEGKLHGLGWIPGTVKRFDESKIQFTTHLPHMGWNDVLVKKDSPIFADFPEDPRFYFLHSYYFECSEEKDSIAQSDYGYPFTCSVNRENIYGVQFHPEKSHGFGEKLLENFSKI
ncbi:MAG: imidazole glycerol phosphate synthase subunit HisH [Saprospiraceae bacterium]|nr:imidazole glycerol phosphate synthase subunit HisH [Saprospiraceae bacterium]